MARRFNAVVLLALSVAALPRQDHAVAQDVAANERSSASSHGNELFERKIRPLLTQHCLSCHGPKKQEAGLRLDIAEGLRQGNDSGPVIVPGEPAESLLIEAVRFDSEPKMPPKGKLPDEAIDALTTWVKLGAPWPADPVVMNPTVSPTELARAHWAFQPVVLPQIPAVKDKRWVQTPVDTFVRSRLDQAGIPPSPPANRRTLLRRVTFDLHGLPPTPEEVTAFEADTAPEAFAKVVDRLLASPRYGERWGRYWLDVARYADTKGYVRLKENPRFSCSWTYRDYVIDAFNNDLPYDQFIQQQLAADQLDLSDNPRPLAALGFLTLGQRFINSQHDIIDDRIDVTTRGLLGLTVTCARCHDHKFDPIPTRDYYSLHGVFASSVEPQIPKLILPASERGQYASYLDELNKRQQAFDKFLEDQQTRLAREFRLRAADYMLVGQKEQVQANFLAVMFLVDAAKDLNPVMIQRWARFFEESRKSRHPLFVPWHALVDARPEEYSVVIANLKQNTRSEEGGSDSINGIVLEAFQKEPPASIEDVARRYASLFQIANDRWVECVKENPTATGLPDGAWDEIRRFLFNPDSPLMVRTSDVEEFLFVDTTTQNQFHEQQRLVEDWIASPAAAPHAMTLMDARVPTNSHIFIRGNSSNPGALVPRQFLTALSGDERKPFQHGSGRLELAQAIASPDNPLTARVLVNRIWMNHFGEGLVRTPSDFGLRGAPPTHPELLNYLAQQFMENGWSIKWLHRVILLSATYQQSSDATAEQSSWSQDPENLLLWKMNRRRLDWEAMRDSFLAVSGRIDFSMGGPSADLFQAPFSKRRTVYGFIDRQSLPTVMRTFDFVPPDASSPQRFHTTVPQQALFLMNHPFLKDVTQHLAARADIQTLPSTRDRIDALYQLVFSRSPTEEEREIGLAYTKTASRSRERTVKDETQYLTAWEEYVQALLMSNEFLFIN